MALIKSISGIRGTIGGRPGEGLSPLDVVKFTAAYGTWLSRQTDNRKVVIGRDGRISGEMVKNLVVSTLNGLGIDVIDLGLSTTPTVELAVTMENAAGGIILTASHNPREWNALKLLNSKGEFISGEDGAQLLEIAEQEDFNFADVNKLGAYTADDSYLQKHIDLIVNYPLVDVPAIKARNFKIVVDAVNSTGALFVPPLLKALGVEEVEVLFAEVNGKFSHNPEPLAENLTALSNEVNKSNADLGIAVDPDVDRLCFVCEDGSMFGEEYTLVAVADYVLSKRKGNTVSNMSSTQALKDVTLKHGGEYTPSAVGEVNVVKKMKDTNAVIGGEGNGGIIVPDLHYGRDALIGIGLFLSHLAHSKKSIKALRNSYPDYFISKNKIELDKGVDVKTIFEKIKVKYKNQPLNTEDGLKIEFDKDWVHLRTSNTEPIIRIYAESQNETTADNIAKRIMQDIKEFMH
ncbi:phosphomannomutase [Chitinophaga ginsengisegetis]|uniref:Phosphomannomutase n=1 Tax=Chitinophaga ginsengisegetis TaxID=393003 RepID=A0A1T5P128_9BACT|nr:phosphoglucosamine mutase [Chitinophaga ginsengisegetis]MDR6566991.1 phosphomannomutase [Chitinophaga ginsengisegetis]MDR6646721.1 phosphomannomutase [Chitinophaga ginsengisegetis]MDR6653071.1 phosphomannomutase [Chitinophaga ginsengisegetis]SKD06009.1 phosphomannomutase [Chitinophaga ginsengisegetis]